MLKVIRQDSFLADKTIATTFVSIVIYKLVVHLQIIRSSRVHWCIQPYLSFYWTRNKND